jgi:hypothetical protein
MDRVMDWVASLESRLSDMSAGKLDVQDLRSLPGNIVVRQAASDAPPAEC